MDKIVDDWLNKPNENVNDYSFKLIQITNKKQSDSALIQYLQKNLLFTYEDQDSLNFSLDGGSKDFIRDYLKSLFPNDENSDSEQNKIMTQTGDFGEATTKLLLKQFYNRDSISKLKYKFHSGRSVFGTDLITFDNISNPTEISFCEVKCKQNLNQKSKGKNENNEDEQLYISVLAHNSLSYDTKQKINPVLRQMMIKSKENREFDIAKNFREIINGNKQLKTDYEIFILTQDTDKNHFDNILNALENIQNKLNPLSITLIIVDDLKTIRTEVWNGIEQYAYSLFGVN